MAMSKFVTVCMAGKSNNKFWSVLTASFNALFVCVKVSGPSPPVGCTVGGLSLSKQSTLHEVYICAPSLAPTINTKVPKKKKYRVAKLFSSLELYRLLNLASMAICIFVFVAVLGVCLLSTILLRWNEMRYVRKDLPPGSMGWPVFGETTEFLKQGPSFIKNQSAR